MASRDSSSPPPELTGIERKCLRLAAIGRTPAEIAHEADLAPERASEVLRSATDKLGAQNLTGAISRAVRLALI